jgi:hypothetical protein
MRKLGHHGKLYNILAKILEKFVPMFEKVLTDLHNPLPRRYTVSSRFLYEV